MRDRASRRQKHGSMPDLFFDVFESRPSLELQRVFREETADISDVTTALSLFLDKRFTRVEATLSSILSETESLPLPTAELQALNSGKPSTSLSIVGLVRAARLILEALDRLGPTEDVDAFPPLPGGDVLPSRPTNCPPELVPWLHADPVKVCSRLMELTFSLSSGDVHLAKLFAADMLNFSLPVLTCPLWRSRLKRTGTCKWNWLSAREQPLARPVNAVRSRWVDYHLHFLDIYSHSVFRFPPFKSALHLLQCTPAPVLLSIFLERLRHCRNTLLASAPLIGTVPVMRGVCRHFTVDTGSTSPVSLVSHGPCDPRFAECRFRVVLVDDCSGLLQFISRFEEYVDSFYGGGKSFSLLQFISSD
ncbi:MAG: hypothetical protein KVP17_001791 [Porospora cf. gigantea B]|uniref:uncharacterized protein n=1 Tax=Porospora cf. gigantea B TaxID=2853592 RepID=UPI003571968E|nr:MAG: hypothetical protein KVP17_001791 [Porospora cf. gigantea B]